MNHHFLVIISCFISFVFNARAQMAVPFLQPRDQIALQLGAIQMGYPVPFSLSPGNATNVQQAINAIAMGRNALDATVSKPAVRVQGVVNSPSVATIAFRDQLYQAVEAVLTLPATGSLKGNAILVSGQKQAVTAKLLPPSSTYKIPVPYALEASYSVTSLDAQGILTGQTQLPANSIGSQQISAGTVPPLKVVSGNVSGVANESYLLQPGSSATITLPTNAAIGDVVKIQGDGLKAKAGAAQGINQWTSRKIAAEYDIVAVAASADGKTIYALISRP